MKCGMLLAWLAVMTVASCSAFPRGTNSPFLSVQHSPEQNSVKFIAVTAAGNDFGNDFGFFDSSFIVENFQRSVGHELNSFVQPFVDELKRTVGFGRTGVVNEISSSFAPIVAKLFGEAIAEVRHGHQSVANVAFDLDLAQQTVASLLKPLDKVFYDAFTSVHPRFSVPLSAFTSIISGLHGAVSEVFTNRPVVLSAAPGYVAHVVTQPFEDHLRRIFARAAPHLANGSSSLAPFAGLFGGAFKDSTGPHGPPSSFEDAPVRITGPRAFGVGGNFNAPATQGSTIVTSGPNVNGIKSQRLVVSAGTNTGPGTAAPHGIVGFLRGSANAGNAHVKVGTPTPPNGSIGGILGAFGRR